MDNLRLKLNKKTNFVKLGRYLEEVKLRNKEKQNLPVLSVSNSNGFVLQNKYFSHNLHSKNTERYKIVSKGEFAYNPSRINVGSIALLEDFDKGLLSPMYFVFKTKNGLLKNYLKYYIQTNEFYNQVNRNTAGTVRKSLNFSSFNCFKINLPPEEAQGKIAEILSKVDEDIETTEKVIKKTERLKKGLMQELLTKGIGHKKFKKTKLGMIPEKWEVKKLKEISDVKSGKRLPKGEKLIADDNGLPYLQVKDMFMGGVKLSNILFVPEHIQEKIKKYTISKDDLFISVAGTLGLIGEVPEKLDDANLTENANKITNLRGVNKKYLLYFLMSNYIQVLIDKEKTTNAQPKLALIRIRNFLITVPPIEEQKEIAKILSKVDDKIEVYQEIRKKLEKLKKGLMQELLR